MERYLFLINPNSGIKINRFIEKLILEKAAEKKIYYSLEYTRDKEHAQYLALKYISQGFGRIVCAGGDGTVREVAQVVAGKDNAAVGIIPCGSGNGAARNLSIPLNIEKAIEVVFSGKIINIDLGICNSKIFINVCGFGFDASVAQLFNRSRIRGLLPYFIYGFKSFLKYKIKDTEIEFDGKKMLFKPFVACVANSRQYGGGAVISPNSMMDDGLLELVVIEKAGVCYYLKNLKTLFNGNILKNDKVRSFAAPYFDVYIPQGSVYHLDGEDFVSEDGHLRISVMRRGLKVIVKDEIF